MPRELSFIFIFNPVISHSHAYHLYTKSMVFRSFHSITNCLCLVVVFLNGVYFVIVFIHGMCLVAVFIRGVSSHIRAEQSRCRQLRGPLATDVGGWRHLPMLLQYTRQRPGYRRQKVLAQWRHSWHALACRRHSNVRRHLLPLGDRPSRLHVLRSSDDVIRWRHQWERGEGWRWW